jgi:glycoprotein-N-acetylgalactosamine 3-beta-galactosyltransferase
MYTYHKRHYLLKAATQSWAFRCDGFLAFTDVTDLTMGAVDLPHQGTEFYGNMWQKVRSIWSYIYTNYYHHFDYFHLAGDDTLMIVDNLRNYLWSINDENGTKPLYLGGWYKTQGITACVGGAGYTLNRVALKWLVTDAFLKPDDRVHSAEDRLMGFTLLPYVQCYDTRDANGGKRYLAFSPYHYGRNCDDGHCDGNNRADPFWQDYVHENVTGVNLISSQAVSFHNLRNQVMLKRVHAIFYQTCPKGTVLADALESV